MHKRSPRFLFLIALLLVGYVGWWFGQSEMMDTARSSASIAQQVSPPKLPAPAIHPLPPTAPMAAAPTQPEGPLARLLRNPETSLKLTAEQLGPYLVQNQRSAESLLAAFRLTGDLAFLSQADQAFPSNVMVQTELALRSEDETERRHAIDAMRRADPANALGDYLSAHDHLRHGRSQQAFEDLLAAAGKTQFDDYSLNAMQTAEEAYLATGFSPVEAKAAAMIGLQRRQIQPMRDLARQLQDLHQGYLNAGDTASAASIRQMGSALGRQMQHTAGYLIDELSGIAIQKQFLDPATDSARQLELTQRLDSIKRSLEGDPIRLLQKMDAPEAIAYFDRLKLYGESTAMQWLRQRHEQR